jgi:hypothetical protein
MSDHIGDANKMVCPHCGLPADRQQNGIQGYRCGSSYCETFRPQWARSMTCLEIENQSMKDAINFFEELSISEGRRIRDASNTAKTTMSDTPITMEEIAKFGRVDTEFALQLERELNAARQISKKYEDRYFAALKRIKQLEGAINRASKRFFVEGSDGKIAAEMLTIMCGIADEESGNKNR